MLNKILLIMTKFSKINMFILVIVGFKKKKNYYPYYYIIKVIYFYPLKFITPFTIFHIDSKWSFLKAKRPWRRGTCGILKTTPTCWSRLKTQDQKNGNTRVWCNEQLISISPPPPAPQQKKKTLIITWFFMLQDLWGFGKTSDYYHGAMWCKTK